MQNLDFSKKIKKATAHPTESFPSIGEKTVPEELPESPSSRPSHRHYFIWILLVFVSFSAGLLAGIQWSRVSHIEDNIVRYPDEGRATPRKTESSTETSRDPTSSDRGDAVSLADMGGEGEGERRDTGDAADPSASAAAPAGDSAAPSNESSDRAVPDRAPRVQSAEGRYIIKVGDFPADRAAHLTESLNALATISSRSPYRCRGVHESVPDRYLTFRTRVKGKRDRENILVGCFTREKDAREILQKIQTGGPAEAKHARIYEIQ